MATARLGHFAPALLGLPGADDPLREMRRSAGARRPACPWCCPRAWCPTARAIRSTRRRRSTNASVRSAARTRAARRTPWTPSWIRPGTSCASRARTRTPWSTSALTTGCRWTSTSAASSTPSCTCCIRASGPRSCATWSWSTIDEPFGNLLTQGMVLHHIYYREPAPGRRDYFNPADVEVLYDGTTSARAPSCSPTTSRWNGTGSARCRSPRTTAWIPRRWSSSSAPTRRACS